MRGGVNFERRLYENIGNRVNEVYFWDPYSEPGSAVDVMSTAGVALFDIKHSISLSALSVVPRTRAQMRCGIFVCFVTTNHPDWRFLRVVQYGTSYSIEQRTAVRYFINCLNDYWRLQNPRPRKPAGLKVAEGRRRRRRYSRTV